MKRSIVWLLGLWLALLAMQPAEAAKELDGLGDMRWGDSVKAVSERYAARYLEETRNGGALYAVNFTDFTEEAGIQGPLVVMGAFEKGKLVQINVPLSTENAEAAGRAFQEYVDKVQALYGMPVRQDDHSALWSGKKTYIFVQKMEAGILVSLIEADRMKRSLKQT